MKELKKAFAEYQNRGFRIRVVHADNEFDTLEPELLELGVEYNGVAANEHVPEIERQIRVIKERIRCAWSQLPYKYKPKNMVIALAKMVVLWLNNFTPKSGVSDIYSPRQIVKGTKLDMKKHCRIEFGAYAQVYDEHAPTNNMLPRTVGCICLGPKDNLQGSIYFLKLDTGKVITRRQFTELPLTQTIVDIVNALGEQDSDLPYLNFADIKDDPAKRDEYHPPSDEEDSVFDFDDYETEDDLTTSSNELTGVDSGHDTINDNHEQDEEEEDHKEQDKKFFSKSENFILLWYLKPINFVHFP